MEELTEKLYPNLNFQILFNLPLCSSQSQFIRQFTFTIRIPKSNLPLSSEVFSLNNAMLAYISSLEIFSVSALITYAVQINLAQLESKAYTINDKNFISVENLQKIKSHQHIYSSSVDEFYSYIVEKFSIALQANVHLL